MTASKCLEEVLRRTQRVKWSGLLASREGYQKSPGAVRAYATAGADQTLGPSSVLPSQRPPAAGLQRDVVGTSACVVAGLCTVFCCLPSQLLAEEGVTPPWACPLATPSSASAGIGPARSGVHCVTEVAVRAWLEVSRSLGPAVQRRPRKYNGDLGPWPMAARICNRTPRG